MRAIDIYKIRLIELIDEATKLDGLKIEIYDEIINSELVIDSGIMISDDIESVRVPLHKNDYMKKDEIIDFLLDTLEDEHLGMRADVIEDIKDMFNVDLDRQLSKR